MGGAATTAGGWWLWLWWWCPFSTIIIFLFSFRQPKFLNGYDKKMTSSVWL
ncbi:hypothetical protein HanIR_Chr05g0239811 [Helianthus annuus]|nr:hypothetical protein HanIR_Chr05g0239811 [Helianthus annuus]